MVDKERLLSHVNNEEDRIELSQILDKADLALNRHQPTFTNFLNPHHLYLAKAILEQIPNLKFLEYGGYDRAERRRISLMPDYYLPDIVESPIVLLDIRGQFKFQKVSHRDFLGSILGTGIKREMVGDLILYKQGCQAVVAKEIRDYLLLNLEQVHKIGVEVVEMDFDALEIEPERIKEINTTVASLRLDSIASSGFSTSRNKMSKEIEQGKVKVNWKVIDNPAHFVQTDDIISIRGRGRVEIDELLGESNRGRIKVKLKRYI
ncbi:photosystem II S4 domain protein [Orenia marismortui]|uniref:photosystem II S4 domain protein n=1 Tax=Orenia marismortui TaxID=46469 RepID=UPI00036A8800|nr:photosystem II S4 domain protein [Orenia marismortui]